MLQDTKTSVRLESDFEKLTKVEEKIRLVPRYENLLKPLGESDFMLLAKDGPIITFMATEMSCEAFLTTPKQILRLPLPDFKFQQAKRLALQVVGDSRSSLNVTTENNFSKNQDLRKILEELWHFVVRPVLKALRMLSPPTSLPPRVW